MIEALVTLLNFRDYHGESELIEIAKGKYKLENTIKGKSKQITRARQWQKKEK